MFKCLRIIPPVGTFLETRTMRFKDLPTNAGGARSRGIFAHTPACAWSPVVERRGKIRCVAKYAQTESLGLDNNQPVVWLSVVCGERSELLKWKLVAARGKSIGVAREANADDLDFPRCWWRWVRRNDDAGCFRAISGRRAACLPAGGGDGYAAFDLLASSRVGRHHAATEQHEILAVSNPTGCLVLFLIVRRLPFDRHNPEAPLA